MLLQRIVGGAGGETEPQMLGVGHRFGEQRPDVVVVKRVDDLPPVTLSDDQPEVAQHPELLGDGRLLHLHRPGQLSDRARHRRRAG